MSEATDDEPPTLQTFSTPEGHAFVKKVLRPLLPYEPHDYQLEGVCKSLDGVDLLAVLATGGGKTGFFSMYMLVTLALSQDPNLCKPPRTDIPKDPAMVIVCPTNGLEEDMAAKLTTLGLRTLVINQDTVQCAKRERQDLWSLAKSGYSMIIMSPEMFTRREYDDLLKCQAFADRVIALGIDEVHLMNSWGKGFRPCFTQLGFIRARMAKRTRLIALTATLGAGLATQNVCKFLGLETGHFYFLKRSNLRPDLQIIFRTLTSGLGGWSFPDFKKILRGKRKTLIFCPTIAQSFRLAAYLISVAPAVPDPLERVRMYNALNWSDYNAKTRDVFQQQAELQIIIATNSLMVGVDLENVADVVIAGEPENVDEALQKAGRAGRNRRLVNDARGIVYVTKNAVANAQAMLDGKIKTGRKKKGREITMDMDMARMLTAACKTAEQNRFYDNPKDDSPCSCASCQEHPPPVHGSCNCSGCVPEEPTAPKMSKRKAPLKVPPKSRLTRDMRSIGTERLRLLRWTLYTSAKSPRAAMLPPSVFLPDAVIKSILDRFVLLEAISDLDPLIEEHTYLVPNRDRLWLTIEALGRHFDEMRKEKKKDPFGSEEGEEEEIDSPQVAALGSEVEGTEVARLPSDEQAPGVLAPVENVVFNVHAPAQAGTSAQVPASQQYPGCFVSSFRLNGCGVGSASTTRRKRPASLSSPTPKVKRTRVTAGGKENDNDG